MISAQLKQKAVFAALGVVAAYAIVAVLWFVNLDRKMGWCPKTWASAMRAYDKACKTYADECRLIGEKAMWTEAYETQKKAMPSFEAGLSTETTWQRKLDEFLTRHHMSISQRQGGKEIVAGEVYELPIEVKSWEGAYESLIKFMQDMENTDQGMFDFGAISIKPSSKRGYLKGSFTLTCAYMRE